MRNSRGLAGGIGRVAGGSLQVARRAHGMAGCGPGIPHADLAAGPGAGLFDRKAGPRVGGLQRLEERQHVLGARRGP